MHRFYSCYNGINNTKMNLTSPTVIKELLSKYETRPSKGLGQNFLIDKNILDKIVDSAGIKPTDIILEVGPGLGVLTQELAKRAKRVIAVEKDETMIEILTYVLNDSNVKNVQIVNEDILQLEQIKQFKQLNHYKVVANIPYYLTSPLIRKFLETKNPPEEIILMLQKEVAQRICVKPPDMNLLAVSVQFYATPTIVSYVSKNCFWPAPKIDSAIIKITPQKSFDFAQGKKQIQRDLFFEVVKAGFSHPRKQLVGNLSKIFKLGRGNTEKWLLDNKINPTQRAETLSIEDWVNLSGSIPLS
jgi:16S rRNA (adenine1518-N6/adenine1519-N6)-dimethyltransferase